MEGLPKLPGLDFENRLKLNHHVAHSFDLVNGYRIPRTPSLGIGKDVLKEDSIAYIRENDATLFVFYIFFRSICLFNKLKFTQRALKDMMLF